MTKKRFMNTEIDYLTFTESLEACCALIDQGSCGHYVVTPNVDIIVRLERDAELKEIFADADLSLADGKPLIWISKLYGTPIPEKVSGSDLLPALCACSVERGYSLFLLGAAEGVAKKAAENLKTEFPGLNIAGTFSPDYGFERDDAKIGEIIDIVNNATPDILVVGLGCPKQEKFIHNYRHRLKVKLSLGLGASIDFAAGNVKRAPKWMSEHGLEWFYRMAQEPGRLAKRYLNDAIHIVPLAIKYRN